MKRDGRTLDHATLETIRLMAVERVLEGEVASAVITSYGFNRTTIYKWLTAAAKPGVGLRALQARPAPGRPRRLTPRQEQQVFRWINGKDPRQYGLDFGLWTRSVVSDLIARKFGITLGLTAVGELLAKLNLTPQKPLQRAYQRDPEAIERWRRETYPTIAQQAKAEGGEVFFWDESGFRADCRSRTDLGRQRTDAGRGPSWSAAINQCRLCGERQGWVLVLYLSRWADGRVVCRVTAEDDAASRQAGAFGG